MSEITVNHKHLKRKGLYVFAKRGIYWGLTPTEVLEMHNLTGELLAAEAAGAAPIDKE